MHIDTLCSFECGKNENQQHIFSLECDILQRTFSKCYQVKNDIKYDHIFGTLPQQVAAVKYFIKIDKVRSLMLDESSPGGTARTMPCTQDAEQQTTD